ncbi:MAG: hypothetical protein ABI637_10050 [Gemmatimonadota bacterium]
MPLAAAVCRRPNPAAWLILLAACSSEMPTTPEPADPRPGTISVTTSTFGHELDPDGYAISVDGGPELTVGINATLTIPGVAIGRHVVRLTGVASNCGVTGAMERVIDVIESHNVALVFAVSCDTNLSLIVTVATVGPSPDPDGYLVTVDAGTAEVIATSGFRSFTSLAAGPHTVTLTGIAANCTAGPPNPATATVVAGQTARIGFTVTCVERTGSIRVTTTTSGVSIATSTYGVVLDPTDSYYGSDGPSQSIPINGTVSFASIAVGSHRVQLTGVPDNCSADNNPRTVAVTDSAINEVGFSVICVATGSLQVSATTSGTNLDANGYGLSLQGPSATAVHIATNGSTTLPPVRVGDYTVTLSDVAPNCTVTSPNPRTVTVAASSATSVAFEIACVVPAQVAFVDAVQSAIYVIKIDGTGLTRLTPPGADGMHPSWSPDGQRLVFSSSRDGGSNIYAMNADGTNPIRLTYAINRHSQPAWSPDGARIAFVSTRDGNAEIYVMNADGSAPVRITSDPAYDANPAWSPDGSRIAFASYRTGASNIYVMNADGSNVVRVTSTASGQPAWSPDGLTIVFSSGLSGQAKIYAINADGTGLRPVTQGASNDDEPAWSADGTRIVFRADSCGYDYYYCTAVLQIVRADGTDLRGLATPGITLATEPAWQP